MTQDGVVEPRDIVEQICPGLVPGEISRAVRSVFSDQKKLSIAALSQTLPDRLTLQAMPLSAISRWNCSLVY
jgi:hypothetical protein